MIGIIFGVSILSISFLVLIQPNYEHERELLEINKIVFDKTDIIYSFYPESRYLETVGLMLSHDFPIMSTEYNYQDKQLRMQKMHSLEEIMSVGFDKGLTHLVLDENKHRIEIFQNMFNNEDEFPFLIKEWDSKDEGFKYHVKIFRIDWSIYEVFSKR